MKCYNCGNEIPQGSKYCLSCGRKIGDSGDMGRQETEAIGSPEKRKAANYNSARIKIPVGIRIFIGVLALFIVAMLIYAIR